MSRIQIWSNAKGSEFAIRLSTDIEDSFHATTKQEEDYVKIVEETEYLHDMKYDWDYTLRYWVEIHHNNKHHKNDNVIDNNRISTTINNKIGVTDSVLPLHLTANDDYGSSIFSEKSENDNSTSLGAESLSDSKNNSRGVKRKRAGWSKLKLKCHYCGLMFSNEKDRGHHEKEWHANKIRKRQ